MKVVHTLGEFELRGHRVLAVQADGNYSRDELLGVYRHIRVDGVEYTVVGVESPAIPAIPYGTILGLMLACPSDTPT